MTSFVSRKWHFKDGLNKHSPKNSNSLFSSRYLTGSFRALMQTTFSETEKKSRFVFFFAASFTNKNLQNEKIVMLCKWCKQHTSLLYYLKYYYYLNCISRIHVLRIYIFLDSSACAYLCNLYNIHQSCINCICREK